tara:strand:+ start:3417 stop:3635 length:219 start_codon:yes stop_codon:yes gene_type:complete
VLALVLSLGFVFNQLVSAQDEESALISIGEVAPDFSLPGATRYGILQDQIQLSDLKGEVVVLAFFFRARTRG